MSARSTAGTASLTLDAALAAEAGVAAATAHLQDGVGTARLAGAPEGAWALLAEHLRRRLGRNLLVVTTDPDALADEVSNLEDAPRALLYPAADVLPMDRMAPSDEVVGARLETQAELLAGGEPRLVIASPLGLMRLAPAAAAFREGVRDLVAGAALRPDDLVHWLVDWGYTRESQVEAPGQFSVRGGIVDVFAPASAGPLRLEFFGDELESIRGFDVGSQVSVARRDNARLLPAREFPLRAGEVEEVAGWLSGLDLSDCLPEVRETWTNDIAALREGGYFAGVESLYPHVARDPRTLVDYFSKPPLTLLLEPARLRAQAERHLAYIDDLISGEADHGELPRGLRSGLVALAEVERGFGAVVELERVAEDGVTDLGWGAPPGVAGRADELARAVAEASASGHRVILLTQQQRRLVDVLEGSAVQPAVLDELNLDSTPVAAGQVLALDATSRSGLTLPASLTTVFSDLEMFGARGQSSRRRARRRAQASDKASAFRLDIQPDQLVVHQDHGIGIFRGLRTVEDGADREYILVEYAGGDKVFVPVEYMDRIKLYVGGGDEDQPRLSRLGTGEWARVKSRVRAAVREMAGELIQIYARREMAPGFAFPPDGPWQEELELAFPYQETPDQLRAIEEIKADMESPRPMDRLLCGDVGFGKTEVALRAAFKAATAGKQVAMLVPTTILANQHFLTFTERLKKFPVRVELLSSFRSNDEAAEVRAGLANGTVDIVIGTHRLLTASTTFKDLGLLIIDEEQRFGVAQKERLKKLRASIDVLSMSATPIPRTLHMSLGGIRDLSVLATAPEERLPVRTLVTADDDGLVSDVVRRELGRGGQVFFLHNRVRSIERAADRVRRLAPEARVAVAHGQMDEHLLANVMMAFVQREYDVLVCTTIIESGLDIPTANTILVESADRFGLADLYQLRGRVGRSGVRAYAYFLYDPHRALTEHADQRLDVIGEYQELGAGFKLAFKDLEIRGAGNLLGREQSGQIAAVGLEMYNQMLRDAVGAIGEGRGEATREGTGPAAGVAIEPPPAVQPLELPLEHYLPHDYVPDQKVRLQVYQELAAAGPEVATATLVRRLKDRFGPVPQVVDNLLYALRVKHLAQAAGVAGISDDKEVLELRFATPPGEDLKQLAARHRHVQAGPTKLKFQWKQAGKGWQAELTSVLEDLADRRVAA